MQYFPQDTCEPKVYVSDRRMAKAIQLLQVTVFCDATAW